MWLSRASWFSSLFPWSHTSSTTVIRTSSTFALNGTAHRALTSETQVRPCSCWLAGERGESSGNFIVPQLWHIYAAKFCVIFSIENMYELYQAVRHIFFCRNHSNKFACSLATTVLWPNLTNNQQRSYPIFPNLMQYWIWREEKKFAS